MSKHSESVAPAFYKQTQVAEKLGIHTKTLRTYVNGGVFPRPAILPNGRKVWCRKTVDQWIEDRIASA